MAIQEESNKINNGEQKYEITQKSTIRQIMDTVVYFAVVLTIVMIVERFVMQPVEVEGSSMEPTLSNENHLLLEKLTYVFGEPKRYDVIVFQPFEEEEDLYYIKRIIGLPGEHVKIENNLIYINGEPLAENYGLENVIYDPGAAVNEVILGEDEFFVMGDNRNHSRDSRDPMVGVVTNSSIVGRAWCRIWPLHDIGLIKHQ